MSDVDTCDMPIGSHARCVLPGDHEDGCSATPPRCLCSHSAWRHVLERDRCRAPGCGCLRNRPKGVTA